VTTGALSQISGAVLNGGRSSRFGTDKAQFVWHGKTLLEHSLASLEGCAQRFVVGGGQTIPGIPLHPDPEPHQGSIYGVQRALEVASMRWIAVCACDMPGLSSAYWAWLAAHLEPEVHLVVPTDAQGRAEPFAAMYSKRCLPTLTSRLERGERRAGAWWHGAGLEVRTVEWNWVQMQFGSGVFLNANTPGDLGR
jgi:molybdopterin-guanine dinucleotide biosynthesis protein A